MTTERTGRPGRYRPGRKRRVSTAMLTLLAAAIAATLLVALGARAVVARTTCGPAAVVHVAVAGEIEPVIQRIGRYFNRQQRQVDGHCAQVDVYPAAAAPVATQLARVAHEGAHPPAGAWIPDSQLWVNIARGSLASARLVRPTGLVVARSPLVIAMPRAVAARTPAFGASVGWNFLLPPSAGGPPRALGLDVQFPDPAQSAAGLASLIELKRLAGYGRPGRGELAAFALNVQVVPATDGGALPSLDAFTTAGGAGSPAVPVTVTSEQAVVQFDRAHPTQPLAVRYPADGTYDLTYPYVLTSTGRLSQAVARAFGGALRSAYATASLRYEGFRSSRGAAGIWPVSYGLASGQPRLLPQPGLRQTATALHAWHVLALGSRFLALNDVSSAMAVRVAPGGPTLEQMLGRTSAAGMKRFPDSTQMGLWVFASHLNGRLPYRQLVPMGPLPAPFGLVTRREKIQQLAAGGRALPRAGAALYGAILAAYKQMVATYQPQYVNDVIVLTAGVESAPGDISAATLVRDIRAVSRPNRQVEILMIVLGIPKNLGVLEQIAKETNGKVWPITSASQVPGIFYHAFGRRICQPHCPR